MGLLCKIYNGCIAAKLTEEAVDAVKPLDGHAFLVELARSLTGRTK